MNSGKFMSKFRGLASAFLPVFAFGFCACCESFAGDSGAANAEYVKAASNLGRAAEAFSACDFSGALSFAEAADKSILKILEKYPESDIALKIVTDPDLRLGAFSYADLRGRILPSLRGAANPKMKPFDISWAVANASKDEKILEYFGVYLAHLDYQVKSLKRKTGADVPVKFNRAEMLEEYFSRVENPAARLAIRKAISSAAVLEEGLGKSANPAEAQKSPAAKRPAPGARQMSDFEHNAIIAASNISATEKLLAFSEEFEPTKEQLKIIRESLLKAFGNVDKISFLKLRNAALVNIAKTMANFGLAEDALLCTARISSREAAEDCMLVVARKMYGCGDYAAVLKIAESVSNPAIKEKIIEALIYNSLESGKIGEAKSLLEKCKTPAFVSAMNLIISAYEYKLGNPVKADLKPFFAASAAVLERFCESAEIPCGANYKTDAERKCSLILAISGAVASRDKKLAGEFLDVVFGEDSAGFWEPLRGKDSFGALAFEALTQAVLAGRDGEKISKFLDGVLLDGGVEKFFYYLSDLGVAANLAGNPGLAGAVFKRASFVCRADAKKADDAKVLYLAWQMQISGFDRAKTAQILGPYLPVFGGEK